MRKRPLVLVLDEPTAALDAETEHALFERYAAAMREDAAKTGKHDPCFTSLLDRMADPIVVLEGARVVEMGTHDEDDRKH